jgi:hypothetical protein
MTYEEFKMKYNIDELKMLSFSVEKELFDQATISDDPKEYIDVAKNGKDLKWIRVSETESAEYYKSFAEFVKNCNDNVQISNGIVGNATKEEFLQGEEIINKIVEEIDPDWSTKQKAAYIHYKIGDLISYAPDYNFSGKYVNSPLSNGTRNIWKSVVKGISVCNGVTSIQRNILSRLGIKTQELSSDTHSFMLVETEEGNIITDATWDLSNSLYGARPRYFGKTYEQLREADNGISNAHKLTTPPENIIEISDEELREIYHILGYTNEDRTFIFPILHKFEEINSQKFDSIEEKLNAFLTMFAQNFSKEAMHLQETRKILEQCIGEFEIETKDLTTKFVYAKDDEDSEKPYLTLHIDNEQMRNKMKFLNLEKMQFEDIDLQEFDKNYRVHILDKTIPFWKKYLPEVEVKKTKKKVLNELE